MRIPCPLSVTLELSQYTVPSLKGKTKFPHYHSARICKITLSVSQSLENCVVILIFVLPSAQGLKMDFSLDWKSDFKEVMTILGKSTTVSLFLSASCSSLPHTAVRSLNQIKCWGNPEYPSSAHLSSKWHFLPYNCLETWRQFIHRSGGGWPNLLSLYHMGHFTGFLILD